MMMNHLTVMGGLIDNGTVFATDKYHVQNERCGHE